MVTEPHAVVCLMFDKPLTGRQVVRLAEHAVYMGEDDPSLPRRLHVAKQPGVAGAVMVTRLSRFPDAQVAIGAPEADGSIALDQSFGSIIVYDVAWPVAPCRSVDREYIDQVKLSVAQFADALERAYDEFWSNGGQLACAED